jgi:hypothetical protein
MMPSTIIWLLLGRPVFIAEPVSPLHTHWQPLISRCHRERTQRQPATHVGNASEAAGGDGQGLPGIRMGHPSSDREDVTVNQTSQRHLDETDSLIEDELEEAFIRMVEKGAQRLHRSWPRRAFKKRLVGQSIWKWRGR